MRKENFSEIFSKIRGIQISIILLGFLILLCFISNFAFVQENNSSSGWNTYRNEIYRYEIKYPNDWWFIDSPPNDISIENIEGERINVFIQKNVENFPIDSWLYFNYLNIEPTRRNEILSGFKRIKIDNKEIRINEEIGIAVIPLPNNKGILTLTYMTYEGPNSKPGKKYIDIFYKIVKSVTFLKDSQL